MNVGDIIEYMQTLDEMVERWFGEFRCMYHVGQLKAFLSLQLRDAIDAARARGDKTLHLQGTGRFTRGVQ